MLREFTVTSYDHNNEIVKKLKERIEWSNLSVQPITFSDIISWLRVELVQVSTTTGMTFKFDEENRHITIKGELGNVVAAVKEEVEADEIKSVRKFLKAS